MDQVYLDYAATAPLKPEVASAMKPFWVKEFGNPASTHAYGRRALAAVDAARRDIARVLNCEPHEVIFTGSGTEADNLAIKGVALLHRKGHIITLAIEHKAVLETCQYLENLGYKITYIKPGRDGVVDVKQIVSAISSDTILVSLMYINNEIGTVQPIREVGKYIEKINRTRRRQIFFHTDAVQAANLFDLNTKYLHVDMLTISAHKLGGPKGAGILFVKDKVDLVPQLHGGGQERGIRSSTLNVAGVVGLAKALTLAQKNKTKENNRLRRLQHWLIKELKKIKQVDINGSEKQLSPSHINISIKDHASDELVMQLDRQNIAVSAASACSAGSIEPSYVLQAMNLGNGRASSSLRVSMGYTTTKTDLMAFLKALKKVL